MAQVLVHFNDVATAVTYAKDNQINIVNFDSDITLANDSSELRFYAQHDNLVVNVNSQNINKSSFHDSVITGTVPTLTDGARLNNSVASGLSGFHGIIQCSLILGDVSFAASSSMVNTTIGTSLLTSPSITVATNANLGIRACEGDFTLAGVSGTSKVSLSSKGTTTFSASCTGGEIIVYSDSYYVDSSAGTTITLHTAAIQTQAVLNDFDPTTDQVIVATNNDKTDYELADNSITSSVIATNALDSSAFTVDYYNSINAEVDTALVDYDAPTKAELDVSEANIIAALPDVKWV